MLLTVLAACNNDSAVEGLYEQSGNTINVNNQRADIFNQSAENDSNDFGYVRNQESPLRGDHDPIDLSEVFDREKVANAISQLCTQIPRVDDVSALVTDEEVLVVYATDSTDRALTADQVKRTAMSIVPRSYHVYVSDNTALRGNVESFATTGAGNRSIEHALNKLIGEMKKSPQGTKMKYLENENGEVKK